MAISSNPPFNVPAPFGPSPRHFFNYNSVVPGPIWTPLIPASMPVDQVKQFGGETLMKRAGQPAELAPVYVILASEEASDISGANMAVTGGNAII